MGGFGSGSFGSMGGAPKKIRLNDNAGSDSFIVSDSDDFPIFKVDSKGNYGGKGVVKKP